MYKMLFLTKVRPSIFKLILIVGFFSCHDDRACLVMQTNGHIVIVDSIEPTKNLWQYDRNERYGYYPIYYIGKPMDTIRLGESHISSYNSVQKDYSKFKNVAWADSLKMSIRVDTAFSLTHKVYYLHYNEKENKEIIDSTKSFNCFAVFVYNLCDSLFYLGRFSELGFIVRQARDEQGNWIDIETPIEYSCTTGARNVVVEPHHCY